MNLFLIVFTTLLVVILGVFSLFVIIGNKAVIEYIKGIHSASVDSPSWMRALGTLLILSVLVFWLGSTIYGRTLSDPDVTIITTILITVFAGKTTSSIANIFTKKENETNG